MEVAVSNHLWHTSTRRAAPKIEASRKGKEGASWATKAKRLSARVAQRHSDQLPAGKGHSDGRVGLTLISRLGCRIPFATMYWPPLWCCVEGDVSLAARGRHCTGLHSLVEEVDFFDTIVLRGAAVVRLFRLGLLGNLCWFNKPRPILHCRSCSPRPGYLHDPCERPLSVVILSMYRNPHLGWPRVKMIRNSWRACSQRPRNTHI